MSNSLSFKFLFLSYLLERYGEDVIQNGFRLLTCERDHDRGDHPVIFHNLFFDIL